MSKKILFGIILIGLIMILTGSILMYQDYRSIMRIKNAIIKVDLVDNLQVEFNSEVFVSDFIESINGEIIDNFKIDTTTLGNKKVKFNFINEEKIKVPYEFSIEIVDKTPPVIWLSTSYTVKVGYSDNLASSIMCGDNYDSEPKKEIIGEYNTNKVGTYPVVYKATDSSGNVSLKEFNLLVKKNTTSSGSSKKIPFAEIYQNHKKTNTKIGIDVSKWQGDIDFSKVKNAGVEFAFIKVGGTNGIGGSYYLDPKFKQNIEGFLKEGIPVGIYFYSYANSSKKAIEDAKWVIEQIKDYDVTFPIAYDWENWSGFNKFKMSFYELSQSAQVFIDTINQAGYQGILYSSKNYLEKIWIKGDYPIWLAHYTTKTNYQGDYVFWQMTSSCVLDGIKSNTVDVNIMYLD